LLGDVIDTTTEAVKKKLTKSKPGKQDDLFPETIPTTPEATKAAKKLSAAEKRKFKKAQTDMFADELKDATEARKVKAVKKRKDAMKKKTEKHHGFPDDPLRMPKYQNLSKKDLAKKRDSAFHLEQKAKEDKLLSKAKKPKKKAAGGPIKFAKGGKSEIGKKILSRIWEKGKEGAAAAKKKSGELLEKSAEKTVDMPKNIRSKITTAKDIAAGKKVAQARHAKLATSGKMTPSQRKKVLKRQAQSGYASGGPVRKSIDGIAQRGLTRAKHK